MERNSNHFNDGMPADRTFIQLDVPMGVSEWMNHGVKYGYAEFFREKVYKESLEDVRDTLFNMSCGCLKRIEERLIPKPKNV